MSTNHDESGANTMMDRVWLPLILPISAAAITAALILGIGSTLLAFNTELLKIGDEHILTPVAIALGMTVVVLIGGTIAAKTWAKDE